MAVIKIFIEGGVLPHPNVNVQTINNSQRLRESFYHLLSQKIDPKDFTLEVEIGGPNNQTIKFFKTEINNGKHPLLLIDLDAPKINKTGQLQALNLVEENRNNLVFFMIQAMESWILSQPNKIELNYKNLKRIKPKNAISNDDILKDKHPEDLVNPADKLHTLIGRFFKEEKKGKWKKKKYNKLKDGADLLELLNFEQLVVVFEDVKNLSSKFKQIE